MTDFEMESRITELEEIVRELSSKIEELEDGFKETIEKDIWNEHDQLRKEFDDHTHDITSDVSPPD